MKVTIRPDGSMELDVANGDGQAALDLIRSLQGSTATPTKRQPNDPAALTPEQRKTYDVLTAHPSGCHYTVVAEYLDVSKSVANSRCNYLAGIGYAERIRSGVYRVVS